MRLAPAAVAALVAAAARGDQRSWDGLVAEYSGLIWSITRSYRLTAAEAADVSQTTWLRLCENIDRLRDPGAVGAWLATTARREAAALKARSRAAVPIGDISQLDRYLEPTEVAEASLMRQVTASAVRDVLAHLPGKTRAMLTMLMEDDPPSYEQVAETLGLPIGSIGPTRGRALRRLRSIIESQVDVSVAMRG